MKKKSKLLCGLCAAALLLHGVTLSGLTPMSSLSVSAEIGIYDSMLLYSVEYDTVSITGSLEGISEDLVIPSEIDGLPVVRITGTAFTNCNIIKTVTIPSSVHEIETGAFAKCTNLISINVDEDNPVYSSSYGILLDKYNTCLLRCPGGIDESQVIFPETVSSIAGTAFQSCINLRNITIPETVNNIGANAFAGCTSLESIILPSTINKISHGILTGCIKLTSVVLPNSLEYIGESAFSGCTSLSDINLPEGITEIPDQLFSGCSSLVNVTLPTSISQIGSNSFSGCKSLEYIDLPNSLYEIKGYAFRSCSSLRQIVLPDSVTLLEKGVFFGCSGLENIVFSNNITELCTDTFYNCSSLKEIELTTGITKIAGNVFRSCIALENITVPPDNEYYLDYNGILMSKDMGVLVYYPAAKQNTNYNIPKTVNTIESGAFESCNGIVNITLPDSVTRAEEESFYNSSIQNVHLSRGLSSISNSMFAGCKKLRYISIPENINFIGRNAFSGCTNLTTAEIADGIKSIESRAFFDCALISVTIPKSVTNIDEYAFGYKSSYSENSKSEFPISAFNISGYCTSAAEKYADNCGFPFIALDEYTYTATMTTTTTVTTTSNDENQTTTITTSTGNTECTTFYTATSITTMTTVTTATTTNLPSSKPQEKGDVNGDGSVNLIDVNIVLTYYSLKCTLLNPEFSQLIPGCNEEYVFLAADMNNDNVININDATLIMRLYAMRSVGLQ